MRVLVGLLCLANVAVMGAAAWTLRERPAGPVTFTRVYFVDKCGLMIEPVPRVRKS